jgi:hypothetical protein
LGRARLAADPECWAGSGEERGKDAVATRRLTTSPIPAGGAAHAVPYAPCVGRRRHRTTRRRQRPGVPVQGVSLAEAVERLALQRGVWLEGLEARSPEGEGVYPAEAERQQG